MAAEETVSLKVMVEKEKNRVIFAEADNDFIDILFSFLTLPMGTIIRLVHKQSPMVEVGCMNKIYESVENCEVRALRTEACKTMLLWPRNAAEAQCKKLKLKIEDEKPNVPSFGVSVSLPFAITQEATQNENGGVFVKETARFMVTDDLQVLPLSTSTSLSLLRKLGVEDESTLEEWTLDLGVDQVLYLLKCSLLSKSPLTDLVFPEGPLHRYSYGSETLKPRKTLHSTNRIETVTKRKRINVDLMIRKNKQDVIYAEVGVEFVDLLFSFLTFPLGYATQLLGGSCTIGCIGNLYLSVLDLDVERYIKSEEHKAMLITPKLASNFGYDNQPLRSTNVFGSCSDSVKFNDEETTGGGGFVKEPARFMVTDDLVVTPISPISGFSLLNRLKVPVSDVEEGHLSFEEDEVLTLLKASLTSKTALTTVFTVKKREEALTPSCV